MNWVQRKIYLYNVTFGLYMLDWWERCLLNTLVVVLMWFVLYNGSRYAVEFSKRYQWNPLPRFFICLFLAIYGLLTNSIDFSLYFVACCTF